MKLAKLLHNPKAGEKGLNKKELIETVESHGWECRYSSTKDKGWEEIHPETDFIIVAGGDGTVKKAAKELLERKVVEGVLPVALLPMGTANNIAKTLGITGEVPEIIRSWSARNLKAFDIGKIDGLNDCSFFLEALGFGVFPRLIKDMNNRPAEERGSPEEELKLALETLHEIILSYEAKFCSLDVDGVAYSGNFLLLEVMNIQSIGPNLRLAPDADPGDGLLEIVMVTEDNRGRLADYIFALLKDEATPSPFETIKGAKVNIQWQGPHLHVDDAALKTEKPAEVHIDLQQGVLEFLIP